ncbi:MAG: replication protein RepA [Candidatus Aenigmatarchaeota archaeon]|nr:MAG: replication protein RepA [Candidatus Aenigmarchaeota archaeon]
MPDIPENDRVRRRMPSLERKVSELQPGDMRVSLIGTVIDKQKARIVLDDGSGKVNVNFEFSPEVSLNQFVRIFGRVIQAENELEIEGEIVQDMEGLDKDLYKKVNSLKLDND